MTFRHAITFDDGHMVGGTFDAVDVKSAVKHAVKHAHAGCGPRPGRFTRLCVCIVVVALLDGEPARCLFRCYPHDVAPEVPGLPEGWRDGSPMPDAPADPREE